MAIPALSKSGRKELKSSAAKFSAYLSFVQEMALIKGVVHRLDIDIDQNSVILNLKQDGIFVETGKKQELAEKLKFDKINCPEEAIYKGVCSVYFFPNGSNTGVSIFLKAKKIDDLLYKIELNRLTGKTYVMGIKQSKELD